MDAHFRLRGWSRLLVLAWTMSAVAAAAHDSDVEPLRAIQARIQQVVESRLPACVAVSDGTGFGSGVVVSPTGLILTAGHVINTGKQEFDVYFPDGRIVRARLLGYHLDVDAGMLQIKDSGAWPSVDVAPSSRHLSTGDWLVSLGHSGGYEVGRKPPVRTGRLLERRDHLLVTDAVLIGGDSGGPLFDLDGRLVAIHSSIGDTIAENRHVTIDAFHRDWSKLQAGQRWGTLPDLSLPAPPLADSTDGAAPNSTNIPLLGVTLRAAERQAIVDRVWPQSPAARVGIKPGDQLDAVDGRPIQSPADAVRHFHSKQSGQSAAVRVIRQGRPLAMQIILDRLK